MSCGVNEDLSALAPQLRDDPELKRFAQSRRTLAADPYRPLYHFVSPERTLNDPNGLCFWQGSRFSSTAGSASPCASIRAAPTVSASRCALRGRRPSCVRWRRGR